MKKLLRFLWDLIVVAFVSLFFTTNITQSFDYWWIALIITVVFSLPGFVNLLQKDEDNNHK